MGYSVEEFPPLLQWCGNQKNLTACMRVYTLSVECGLNSHCFLGGYFIRTFALCGSLMEASKHFLRLSKHNVFTFTGIISAHANNGLGKEAIQLYNYMLQLKIEPDGHAFVALLKSCSHSLSLLHGMLIHYHIVESSLELDCHIGNTLIDMYGRNSCVHDACKVFDGLERKGVVTWNTIIAGYAQNEQCQEVFQLFQQMEDEGIEPDNFTLVNVLKACCSRESFNKGKLVHAWVIEKNFYMNAFLCSTLIDMYVKCGSIKDARMVFDSSSRDVVIWNNMIVGYVVNGLWEQAWLLFKQMQRFDMNPNKCTFVNVLRIFSEITAFEEGKVIHSYVVERACDHDIFVVNALVDMYAKCSSLLDAYMIFDRSPKVDVVTCNAMITGYFEQGLTKEAFHLFDIMQGKGLKPDVVTWNAILAGCVQNKLGGLALIFFKQMQQGGILPDTTTYVALLKACTILVDLAQGKVVYALIIENGDEMDTHVGNTLIGMYFMCGKLEEACAIFLKLPKPDRVTWNTMIDCFSEHGLGEEALEHFHQMQQNGWKPDKVTILSTLKACATVVALKEGMLVHDIAIVHAWESEIWVDSSLIDMYARCGKLDEALKVFERSSKERTETWNALISGSAVNLKYNEDLYAEMRQHGVKPDGVSFLCLLSACSHMGLIMEGYNHFVTMRKDYKITPTVQHYSCMVDLWGRVGCLNEAHQILLTMPLKCNIEGWMCLLQHAQIYGRFELAKECLDQIIAFGCMDATTAAHTVMKKFFSDVGLHCEADNLLIDSWRIVGKAYIEVDDKVHSFLVRDKSHAACKDVYAKLRSLILPLNNGGFVPHHDMVKQKLCIENMDNFLPYLGKLAFSPISYKEPQKVEVPSTQSIRISQNVTEGKKLKPDKGKGPDPNPLPHRVVPPLHDPAAVQLHPNQV